MTFVSENAHGSDLPDSQTTQGASPTYLERMEDKASDARKTRQMLPESIHHSLRVEKGTPTSADCKALPPSHASHSTVVYESSPQRSTSMHSSQFLPPPDTHPEHRRSSIMEPDHSSPLNRTLAGHSRRQLDSRVESMLIQNFVKELASWVRNCPPCLLLSITLTEHHGQSLMSRILAAIFAW